MPTVIYVQSDGTRTRCELASGDSVMDGALDNDIPGIVAQCGGGCTCATCHCYVHEPFLSRLPPPHPDELDMLEYVWQRRPGSRLSCQVIPDAGTDGMVVTIPAGQA